MAARAHKLVAYAVLLGLVVLVASRTTFGQDTPGLYPEYTFIHEPGYCVWYGECGESIDLGIPGNLNCPYNGPAKNVTPVFQQQIADYCGDEWLSVDQVCCDYASLQSLQLQMQVAEQMVVQCPACWQNFRTYYCHMTCSPNASMFMNVTGIGINPAWNPVDDPDNTTMLYVVTSVDVYVEPAFGIPFFNSCAQVTFGMSNTLAMSFLGGGADNYYDFLSFMGRKQLQGSPFDVQYPIYPDEYNFAVFEPFMAYAYACNEGSLACTCVDCKVMCPTLDPLDDTRNQCKVGSLGCLPFALLTIFGILLVSISAVSLYRYRKSLASGVTGGLGEKAPITINVGQNKKTYKYVPEGNDPGDQGLDPEVAPADAPQPEWKIYTWLQRRYYKLGLVVAKNTCIVILCSIIFVGIFSRGLNHFRVVTDPVEIWSDENSITRQQKNFFDQAFGPFYRTEQLILSPIDPNAIAIQEDLFRLLFAIEAGVANLSVTYNDNQYTLDSTCYKALGEEYGCVVYSVTGYWQYNIDNFNSVEYPWYTHFQECMKNPAFPGETGLFSCLPPWQDPIKPEIALGGFSGIDFLNARALVVTWVVDNSLDEEYLGGVYEWEKALVQYLTTVADENEETLRITFFTESGIELELARASTSDVITVIISYIVMLLYVSVALGRFSSAKRVLIDTKFTLGIAGVVICICSIIVAIGLFSFFGVGISLIIAEVIPFLVLAVGVDNIFILVNEFETLDKSIDVDERIALTLKEVGPSITLSALSETVAFSLGAVVSMPAVNSFAGLSAVAVFVDFLMQITLFLTLLAADARRTEAKRLDCAPCVSMPQVEDAPVVIEDGFLKHFVRHYYSRFLLHPVTKVVVLIFFAFLFILFASLAPYIQLGLDQTVALPQDSYLIPYFADQISLLMVGVPVYFVISGGNVTGLETKQQMCAAYKDCNSLSVPNILVLESERPQVSTLALRPSIWLDDFLAWANPGNSMCCRLDRSGEPCYPENASPLCTTCYSTIEYNDMELGPEGMDFMDKLDFWLSSVPSQDCVRAGMAAYGTAIAKTADNTNVVASHFRTYHTVIQTQEQYINAYVQALRICDEVMLNNPSVQCFPYTIFYIYFEQYLNIIDIMAILLIMAALAVFIVTWLIIGSVVAALWVIAMIVLIVVDLAGVMAVWGISLNAISLVNMVMALGISVEFCSHIVRAFTVTQGTRQDRARIALIDIGASVFSGVTLTKFAGVIVLAFAKSQIFVIYYFRMYLSIVLLGFGHGLVLLPVLLSLWGPHPILVNSDYDHENDYEALGDPQKPVTENTSLTMATATGAVSSTPTGPSSARKSVFW